MQKTILSLVFPLIIMISGCVSKPAEHVYVNTNEASSKRAESENYLITKSMELDRRDVSFLERGLKALADGNHISAVQFFQRHSRTNNILTADWEAAVAIGYVSMLPGSPFYDMKAVRVSYTQLATWSIDESLVNSQIVLMWDALEAFVSLHRQIRDLQKDNDVLEENLAKRESALRRLRELTLGQQREVAQ